MKKLMFAALALASCSVIAAINVEVNDLTITRKSLEYATKTYTFSGSKFQSEEAVVADVQKKLDALKASFDGAKKEGLEADELGYKPELLKIKSSNKGISYTYKFVAPSLQNIDSKTGERKANKTPYAVTKVVTKKLNGFVIVRGDDVKTYLWDNVKNPWKQYDGYEMPFKFDDKIATDDGKASLNASLKDGGYDFAGVATGTSDKSTKAIKSVSGNFADLDSKGYGTWKYAINKTVTKKAVNGTYTDDESILKSKKVELVK